jgi:hypothetical protein
MNPDQTRQMLQQLLTNAFGGGVVVIMERVGEEASTEPFGKMRAEVQRSVDFLREIEGCCPVSSEGWSEIEQTFLRVARRQQIGEVKNALTVAIQSGALAQNLERMLRIHDVNCWLIAIERDSPEGQSLHLEEELAPGVPLLVSTLSRHSTLVGTLFKEPNSYYLNFNKLLSAEQPPCACHPRGKKNEPREPQAKGDMDKMADTV